MVRAMMELEGEQRTRALLAGLEHEERVRRDPNCGPSDWSRNGMGSRPAQGAQGLGEPKPLGRR